jgi:mannose/cellobiose epimerase-like protein (N-acyl-D-glucosamine 2-epimerase family)
MAQIDPAARTTPLRQFADAMHAAYWDNGYRSGARAASGVPAGDRFYDDNAHLAVSYVEAHRLTGDSLYLDRAKATYSFVLQGEDSVAGGGIYFQQFDGSSKDAISTLQAARAAAMLYRQTAQPSYLNDATRLLTWANTHIQRADGLYSERWKVSTNAPEGFDLINSAGIGISTNLELYGATGTAGYLAEARRLANRSLSRYFDGPTGRINDEGYWAFELVDALDDLYRHDRDAKWINAVDGALTWLHDNKRDPNGHYGLYWGRDGAQTTPLSAWNLNDQASVARAYLHTGAIPEPSAAALLLLTAAYPALRRRRTTVGCRRSA